MGDKMKAAFESWGVERSKKISTLGIPTPYEYVEWTLDYLRSQQEPVTNDEALRADAERYRWLRKGESDDIAVVRGLGAMDYGMSAVAYTYSEEIDGDDLDAAIDAAMQRTSGGDHADS